MELKQAVERYLGSLDPKDHVWDNPHLAALVLMTFSANKGHTGAHQPILQPTADAARSSLEAARPSPQVPAAPAAKVVETLAERYGALKRNIHDYLVTLPKDSPCWDNTFLPTLAEQVGLTNEN